MRILRYCINVTLDGCCDHRVPLGADELDDMHTFHLKSIERADALLFGRVTYEMMQAGWRSPAPGATEPFGRIIDKARKYVISSTLKSVDWNGELLRGDLKQAVRKLKAEPGKELLVGGLKLPLSLAELGLIDEYEFVVQPRLVGHGPTLFEGLSKPIDLKPVSRLELPSGLLVTRYKPATRAGDGL